MPLSDSGNLTESADGHIADVLENTQRRAPRELSW
jgi:hypothetical protein